jgi:hypothetical protein
MDTPRLIKLTVKDDQQAFDKVMRHLSKMTEPAMGPNPKPGAMGMPKLCLYETPDGRRCAIGALMDLNAPKKHAWAKSVVAGFEDIQYDPDYDDDQYPEDGYWVDVGNVNPWLLIDLQVLHDTLANWTDGVGFHAWDLATNIAKLHGVNMDALDALGV